MSYIYFLNVYYILQTFTYKEKNKLQGHIPQTKMLQKTFTLSPMLYNRMCSTFVRIPYHAISGEGMGRWKLLTPFKKIHNTLADRTLVLSLSCSINNPAAAAKFSNKHSDNQVILKNILQQMVMRETWYNLRRVKINHRMTMWACWSRWNLQEKSEDNLEKAFSFSLKKSSIMENKGKVNLKHIVLNTNVQMIVAVKSL